MHAHASALNEMRIATRDLHDSLEKTLIVTLPRAGRTEYVAYIAALWGWIAPFEEGLWAADWPDEMTAAHRGGKRRWIESDLHAAQLDQAAILGIPVSPFMPALGSLPERFGLAYVLEGAQLGTQVLRKRLAPSLGGWSPRWLQGYGPDTSTYWRIFVECAERHLDTPQSRQTAALAARRAFEDLGNWLRLRGVA